MSLAFTTALLFLLAVPGIVFRLGYLSGEFSKRYVVPSPSDEVTWAIIPAVLLHALGLSLLSLFTPYRADFQTLGVLLIGAHTDSLNAAAFANLWANSGKIVAYNGFLGLVGWVMGDGARRLVIRWSLDTKFRSLRFSNEFWYYLTGREWNLKQDRDFDIVWLDALVLTGSGALIYSGIFRKFDLREGRLDSICLSEAQRVPVNLALKNSTIDAGQSQDIAGTAGVEIPGKGLILKYENILNLNVSFYSLTPQSPSDNNTFGEQPSDATS
jgi:hypothetical protein